MPDLNYVYMPLYGTEPYADNGGLGGAVVTQDNLIVTAWQIGKKFGTPPDYVSFSTILKPSTVNTLLPPSDRVAGTQAFGSRHSGLAYINGNLNGANLDPITAVAFVLNPPPEMKQLLQGAVQYNGGDPFDPASFTVTKSLQSAYLWRIIYETAQGAHNVFTNFNNFDTALFSTYLNYTDLPFDAQFYIPFLKTSGANGVAPVFFDASIASGVNQMIEAVNDGEFFIVYTMAVDSTDIAEDEIGNYCGMVYPHSTARG